MRHLMLCDLLLPWLDRLLGDRWNSRLFLLVVLFFLVVLFLFFSFLILFLILHAFGSHWTYSLVPYDAAFEAVTGHSFNALMGWDRNQYDRIVHFAYGLLLAYPMRELFLRSPT